MHKDDFFTMYLVTRVTRGFEKFIDHKGFIENGLVTFTLELNVYIGKMS